MVDELMRAAWGRTYTQKDTVDYIERSTQTLANIGNPDSSNVHTYMVEQPGTVQMSGDVADPEDFGMPPEETRANIEKHVRRSPPARRVLEPGR